ncbi:hypothetical protein AB0H57_21465 [Micromonospora sp. NPDC050686]|uniref:hypothetical protein n=1 Tax=Micromonospora sp. NPDC050686 TaxID=3154631 RepID=UPI0033CB947B
MAADGSERSDRSRAGSVVPGWSYDRVGRLVFTGESGIPDAPLATALRAAISSSLVGVLVGVVVVFTAVGIGWEEPAIGVAALGALGMPPVRRGYRLRAALALTVTAVGCLVAGIFLDRWLASPWDFFVPLALALTIGSLAGTAVAYLPWQSDERRG